MVAKKTGTKDKILELLKKQQKLSVNELSGQLHITEMGVRKHLGALEKDGFVKAEDSRQPIGRPVQLFSLTDKAESLFPKNYESMTVNFLNDIKNLYGQESINQLFDRRKERLSQSYKSSMANKRSHSEKIKTFAKLQDEKGYMSQLNKINDSTYELMEYNCPILAVANQFKLACQRETSLIKSVLGAESVERIMCRADGEAHCRFMIKFKNSLQD